MLWPVAQGNWQDESRLERLAYRAGVTPEEVCEWLRDRVGARCDREQADTAVGATAKTEAVPFVELRGDSPEKLAAAVEALLEQAIAGALNITLR